MWLVVGLVAAASRDLRWSGEQAGKEGLEGYQEGTGSVASHGAGGSSLTGVGQRDRQARGA